MNKILILGASGMLGHKVFEVLSKIPEFDVYGTVINLKSFDNTLPSHLKSRIIENVYADDFSKLSTLINTVKPNIVVNCIGLIKQKNNHDEPNMILLNALFPHQINSLCKTISSRFITIATDCVFDGRTGNYSESDLPTCHDTYGMTKYLGEIQSENAITLRTSIVGHELKANVSLVDWFLSQKSNSVKGYTNAIFSGLPTVSLTNIIAKSIIPNEKLQGLYHISASPISKFDLLEKIAFKYEKKINIVPDNSVKIDRSLNSSLLRGIIRYKVPSWDNLIADMHHDFLSSEFYTKKRNQYEKNNNF